MRRTKRARVSSTIDRVSEDTNASSTSSVSTSAAATRPRQLRKEKDGGREASPASSDVQFPSPNSQDVIEELSAVVVQHTDEKGVHLSSEFGLLPSQDEFPDGYKMVKKPIDPKNSSGAELLCAVCGDAESSFAYGVRACTACKLFFSKYSEREKVLKCLGNGNCVISPVHRKCMRCRMEKCLAAAMRKENHRTSKKEADEAAKQLSRAKKEAEITLLRDKSSLEEKIVAQRNHLTPLSYARAVVRVVVHKAESPLLLSKLLAAVEKSDTETECVPYPYREITVCSNTDFTHVFMLRVFRWNRVDKNKVYPVSQCLVDSEHACINPYHYDRVPKKKPLGKICVVTNCNSCSLESGKSFFTLPNRTHNEDLYLKYFAACARKDLEESGFQNHHRICSAHFRESDFVYSDGRRTLKKGALPSQFLGRKIAVPYLRREIVRPTEDAVEKTRLAKMWNLLRSVKYESVRGRSEWRRVKCSEWSIVFGRVRILPDMKVAVDTVFVWPSLQVTATTDNCELPHSAVDSVVRQHTLNDLADLRKLCDLDFASYSNDIKKDVRQQCEHILQYLGDLSTRLEKTSDGEVFDTDRVGEEECADTDCTFEQKIVGVVRFTAELLQNSLRQSHFGNRYSDRMIRFCSIFRSISTAAYRFFRSFLFGTVPHPNHLRDCTSANVVKEGIRKDNMGNIASVAELVDDEHLNVELITDQTFMDEKMEYRGGDVVGIASNQSEIVAAKHVLLIILQSFSGKVRKIVGYYFLKNMKGSEMAEILEETLIVIAKYTKFRVWAWSSDYGAENVGCHSKLLSDKTTFPWRFEHPYFKDQFVYILLDIIHIFKRLWVSCVRDKNGFILQVGDRVIDFSYLLDIYEIERGCIVKNAPDLTAKVFFPNGFEKMDVSNAERIFCSDRTLGTLKMLANTDHPLLAHLANRRTASTLTCRTAVNELIWFIEVVRKIILPLTVLSPSQAARLRQPLYSAITAENIDSVFGVWVKNFPVNSVGAGNEVRAIRTETVNECQTVAAQADSDRFHVCIYGTEAICRQLLNSGVKKILLGKLTSDYIERIFSGFKYGSGKVTAGKVREEIGRAETLQALTKSPNVSWLGRRKRGNDAFHLSNSPLKKKARVDAPLRAAAFDFENSLKVLQSVEDLSACALEDIFLPLQETDPALWSCEEIVSLVLRPPTDVLCDEKDILATAIVDIGGYIVSRVQRGKISCGSCKSGIGGVFGVQFTENDELVAERSRTSFGGLSLPSRSLNSLLCFCYNFFVDLSKIRGFYSGDCHLERSLKLILLIMELRGFHPFSDICVCESTKYLEYECLRRFLNLLYKNDMKKRRLDALEKKHGARKPVPMSSDPSKLDKLKQL